MTKPPHGTLAPDTVVAFLGDIFARRGGEEYLGEAVTMAEHMLQGAHLAEQGGEEDVIVVAALLHDIGHFTSEFGAFAMDDTHDKRHEQAGAEVLNVFSRALSLTALAGMSRPSATCARSIRATSHSFPRLPSNRCDFRVGR